MTSAPRCIDTDDTLQKAAQYMASDGVGSLPICGPDGELKGVLTDRDIVVRGVAQGKRLSDPAGSLNQGVAVTVDADDTVDELVHTMAEHQVKRVPVVDEARLVGIVSVADVARSEPRQNVGDLVNALSTP
ncbi:CBS domain-containing protein [Spiractinospora alimapuensis]|nr:CBS domain-containing protein [Spiractinospora alimapuensis]